MTRRSQVLLQDPAWIERCVRQVPRAPAGVEWAAGRGALTRGLVGTWDYVLAVELEFSFCLHLRASFPARRLGVVCGDIRTMPPPPDWASFPLVGNLPYHLTGPLLIRILRLSDRLDEFQGLVQAEVADRLTASPGDSDFGGISLLYAMVGEVESAFRVPPQAFEPSPEVESTWIRFTPGRRVDDFEGLRRLVRRCFRYPRKTLLNNLADEPPDKDRWRRWMDEQGWDVRRRPATLTPQDLGRLYDAWTNRNRNKS